MAGKNDGLCFIVAQFDDVLLNPADLLDWEHRSKLTSGDEDRVTYVKDLVYIVDGIFVLQLGHDSNIRILAKISKLFSLFLHDLLELQNFLVTVI